MPLDLTEVDGLENIPNLQFAQWIFEMNLANISVDKRTIIMDKLMAVIEKENMAPLYKYVCRTLNLPIVEVFLQRMQSANKKRLQDLDEKIADAENNLGETEIREAMIAKAHYLSGIGDKTEALTQFRIILDKVVLPGVRLDLIFHLIRLGFFFDDHELITNNIEKANSLIEEGGDWDRRNRLKVYRGLYSLSIRDFEAAANHFLDAVATFTSYELMDYKTFIVYTVLTSLIALKRPDLHEKVILCSEVQQILHGLPSLQEYLMSFFECRYSDFFICLSAVERYMISDRYLAPHVRHYTREMRIRAYGQHLDSYSSLSLSSMASTFGVTDDFLDIELSRFIASGRLACKIDKVAGILETTRSDNVNFQYQAIIKHGDVLLNRIQKLSQVISM